VTTDQPDGKGRPRKWCPEHKKTVKLEHDRDRARVKRSAAEQFTQLLMRGCCADARRVKPRVETCEQCQAWARFLKQTRKPILKATPSPAVADVAANMAGGFRVSADPDSYKAGWTANDYANDAWVKANDPDYLRRERETMGRDETAELVIIAKEWLREHEFAGDRDPELIKQVRLYLAKHTKTKAAV
jgi:hypothetical protein